MAVCAFAHIECIASHLQFGLMFNPIGKIIPHGILIMMAM